MKLLEKSCPVGRFQPLRLAIGSVVSLILDWTPPAGKVPWASPYAWEAKAICRKLLAHCTRRAASRAALAAGNSSAMRIPMIVITTRSSTRVNPPQSRRHFVGPRPRRRKTAPHAAANINAIVPGSGTANRLSARPAAGDPPAVGSKRNVPPAPMARGMPAGRTSVAVSTMAPAATVVPPV